MPCGLVVRSVVGSLLPAVRPLLAGSAPRCRRAASSSSPTLTGTRQGARPALRVSSAHWSSPSSRRLVTKREEVFPACGRRRAEDTAKSRSVVMGSLPEGKGADELVAQSCAALGACSRDTPKLSPEEVEAKMEAVPLWVLNDDKTAISRSFTAKNWQSALDFINGMSVVAEEEGHHPDFHLTNYRDVRVDVTTHAIGGLSLHDFVLAAKLDKVEVTYSPKWLRENSVKE